MEVKSKEDVKTLLELNKKSSKEIIFGDSISKLKSGEGIFFLETEWKLKTTPGAYYYNRFRKGKDVKTLSISKVKDGYLITKV